MGVAVGVATVTVVVSLAIATENVNVDRVMADKVATNGVNVDRTIADKRVFTILRFAPILLMSSRLKCKSNYGTQNPLLLLFSNDFPISER